ncbi:MAG: bifunctional methylenetetrahydrofolate dehydrogenase/methenyltetrahydrofolate cyclohydrolase FolD [Candidatus Zixiibacteriota bacterium]
MTHRMTSEMTATLIDGKLVAEQVHQDSLRRAEALKTRGVVPGLAAVLVGDNPASKIYVTTKAKTCRKMGLHSEVITRPDDITQDELIGIVRGLNNNDRIHGILVQSPLPKQIDELTVTLEIRPDKDVDGFHPHNVGLLLINRPQMISCTPYGIIKLLEFYELSPAGKEVVVVGRSNIVGKPLAALLMQKARWADATVTVAHSRTADLRAVTRRADILIAAIGQAELITGDMVKPGAVVIDVGMNRVEDATVEKGYRLVGDVKFDEVAAKASHITPVPGGVGPMTIAMLIANTVTAAERQTQPTKSG